MAVGGVLETLLHRPLSALGLAKSPTPGAVPRWADDGSEDLSVSQGLWGSLLGHAEPVGRMAILRGKARAI